jgi:proline iminopeptidase
MSALFPPLSPYRSGHLPVSDGHNLYFECSGNPHGIPAVVLHGGPGSGRSETARQYFDPDRYHIIQFDQRHCGRSLPHAGDPVVDLSTNTLPHLLRDIETLRQFLAIKRWLVVGGSWGSTLALAYGQTHPHRVLGFVLSMVVTTSAAEIEWITRGVGQFFPREHQRFTAYLPEDERDGDLASAYHRHLISPDKLSHEQAASAWCEWENSILVSTPAYTPNPRWKDARFRLCFARLVTHTWANRAWLAEGQIMNHLSRLADIPAILIHGRLDFGSPLKTAFEVHQAWPGSQLIVVENGGHDSREPDMASRIVESIQSIKLKQSEFG